MAISTRWLAVVSYRTADGELPVEHHIEELQELHDLIELGPDWNSIIEIKVTLQYRPYEATIDNNNVFLQRLKIFKATGKVVRSFAPVVP
jgi:hypothetical protein